MAEPDFDLEAMLASILDGPVASAAAPVVTAPPSKEANEPVTILVTPTVFTDSEARKELPALSFPEFTTDEIAKTMDIRNYATMVRLRVRKWHARVKDKRAAKNIAAQDHAIEGAYSVYRRLLAGAEDKLKRVHSVIDGARTRHYEMTLPWSTTGVDETGRRDGPRLLANTLFMEYITALGSAKTEALAAIADLKSSLPSLIESAKASLGTSFDETQYPHPDQLDDMFSLDYDVQPIPLGVDFKGLPGQQVDALRDKMNANVKACLENAMRDVWLRLDKVVRHMAVVLGEPEKAFHDTLVGNVRETVQLARHLNATGDKGLSRLVDRIDSELTKAEPEELRKSQLKRATVALAAKEILDDMSRIASKTLP